MEFSWGGSEVRECEEKDEKTEDEIVREEERKLFEGMNRWLEENKKENFESKELNQDKLQKEIEAKEKSSDVIKWESNEQKIELPVKERTLDLERLSEKVRIEEITIKDLEQIQELAKEKYIEQMERVKSHLKQIREERDRFAMEKAIESNLLDKDKEELAHIKDSRSEVTKEIEEELKLLNEDEHALEKIEQKREKLIWEWSDQVHQLNEVRGEVEQLIQERKEKYKEKDRHLELLEIGKDKIEQIKQERETVAREKETLLTLLESEREEIQQIRSELDTLAKENEAEKTVEQLLSQTKIDFESIKQKEPKWEMEVEETLNDLLKYEKYESKFRELMRDYFEETNKKANRGLKFTKKFKNWLKAHPSLETNEKQNLFEYCNNKESEKRILNDLKVTEMQELARRRGGKCLSTEYVNTTTKLVWQCVEGHVWEASPEIIKRGRWCVECTLGISERICQKIFEKIFQKEFPKSRPEWLINNQGNKMELDGYNRELALAFEYQGRQHYQYNDHFHKSLKEFKQRKADDKLKRDLCEKNGVTLIVVPFTIEYNKMQDFIINKCKEKKIDIPKFNGKIDYKKLKIYSPNRLEEMQELARQRDGKCLSTEYINSYTKLTWQCQEGHVWEAPPEYIKSGTWCPECGVKEGALKRKLTIEEMQELARQRGGKCLSPEYVNNSTKLKWQCQEGHVWKAVPLSVKRGKWCPECGAKEGANKRKLTIGEMQELARQRCGKCLSTEYINSYTKLTWQCQEGHVWKAVPLSVKNGVWCPKCGIKEGAHKRKSTIGEMQELARQRGGKCLSAEYVDSRTKLTWQCEEGHVWKATPDCVKRGTWCPECGVKEGAHKRKLTIGEMQELAKQRGGKCLSTEYVDSRTKLTWQCEEGHVWKARQDSIKRGSWCPKCAKKKRSRKLLENL